MGLKFHFTKHFFIFFFLWYLNSSLASGFTLLSCRISFNIAICSRNNLKLVPVDIPPIVKGIDLSYNKIPKLQGANFTNFPILTDLNLRHNSIWHIGQGTFSQLTSLRRLILNTNQLNTLDDGVFDGLTNLEELRLGFNKIKMVAQNAFKSLKNLQLLEFSGNKLRSIAQVHFMIQHTPHLRQLDISNTGIKTFQSLEFSNYATKLKLLDLSVNPLSKFKVTTNIFPDLTWLSIGSPSMKLNLTWDVPDKAMLSKVAILDVSRVRMRSNEEMQNLLLTFNSSLTTLRINAMEFRPTVLINNSCSIPTVTTLQMECYGLSFISSDLFINCINVTEIDLDKNRITKIANNSFNFLPQLRILSFSRNRLPAVPLATRNIPTLSELHLSFNSIETLRCYDFANLTNLKQLSLQYNSISTLKDCVFQNLLRLQVLELQGNHMANLNNAFQTSLPRLKILRLNNNSLTALKNGQFSGLPMLQNLSLFQNQLTILEKNCFVGLTNLLYLKLQSNNIVRETLDKNSFKHLVNLKSLFMGDNHIKYTTSKPLTVPPFRNLTNLESLEFPAQHYRGKSQLPSNFLQGLTNLLTLNCKNNQLVESSVSEDFFIHTPKLDSLDISANDVTDFSPHLFAPIRNLTKLRVTSTNLRSLDFLIDAKLEKLSFLQARKNAFSVITKDIVESLPSLLYLDLQYNSFWCDCDNSFFLQWAEGNNQTQVFDAHSFKCNYPPHQRNAKLLDLKVQTCLVDVGFIFYVASTSITVIFMIGSFTYHFLRYQLAYAYYIFLAWLYDMKKRNKQAPGRYDAFVSYNVHDEPWVFRELVPHLEERQGWKLCLHHRDFEPGKPIMENITEAIYSSRKTLCVISHKYLQSEWCSREMQVASFRLFDERKDVLILVFLEDIPSSHLSPFYRMRKLLKSQTYLSWPRAQGQTHLFWEKLRQALGRCDAGGDDRLLLTVTDTQ